MIHGKSKLSKAKNDRISNEELRAFRATFKRKLHSIIYGAFRRLRREEGLTQKDLAERLGVDPALISKRLAGDANITLNTLSDLARAMEMTIDASAELWTDIAQEKTKTYTQGYTLFHDDVTHPEKLLENVLSIDHFNQWFKVLSTGPGNVLSSNASTSSIGETYEVITADTVQHPRRDTMPRIIGTGHAVVSKKSGEQTVSCH